MKQQQLQTPSEQEADQSVSLDRRKTIAGIVAGGAVASVWAKPIVNAVVLPAHADMSADVTDTDVDTDMEPVIQDFFVTVASATEVNTGAQILLDMVVQPAYAITNQDTNEEPLNEIRFEAEALDKGNGNYDIRIAADQITTKVPTRTFIFGWEGTISGLNTNAALSGTGCAQNENAQITAIGTSSLTLEMSYFSRTISLELKDGSADLPTFPLLCN